MNFLGAKQELLNHNYNTNSGFPATYENMVHVMNLPSQTQKTKGLRWLGCSRDNGRVRWTYDV